MHAVFIMIYLVYPVASFSSVTGTFLVGVSYIAHLLKTTYFWDIRISHSFRRFYGFQHYNRNKFSVQQNYPYR